MQKFNLLIQSVNNPKNIARDTPTTNIIPRIITIMFLANSIRNIIPKYASRHHQKLKPAMYETTAIIASPRIHRIGKLLNNFFIFGFLSDLTASFQLFFRDLIRCLQALSPLKKPIKLVLRNTFYNPKTAPRFKVQSSVIHKFSRYQFEN